MDDKNMTRVLTSSVEQARSEAPPAVLCGRLPLCTVFDDVKWFALFLGDPTEGGLEVDLIGTNYERVEIPNDGDMWDPASGGFKSNLLQITWPVASATWNFVPAILQHIYLNR